MSRRTLLAAVIGVSAAVLATTASGAPGAETYDRLYGATLSVTIPGSAAETVRVREIKGGRVQREARGDFSMEDVVVKSAVTAGPSGGKEGQGKAVTNRFRTDLSQRVLAIAFEPAKGPRAGVTLTVRLAMDPAIRAWFKKGGARNISVSVLGPTNEVVREYGFTGCEPAGLTAPMLTGGGAAGTVETDVLTVKTASMQVKGAGAMPRWFNSAGRATATVALLKRDGTTNRTYAFPDASITKLELTPLDAEQLDVEFMETYSFKVDKPGPFF